MVSGYWGYTTMIRQVCDVLGVDDACSLFSDLGQPYIVFYLQSIKTLLV